MPTTLRGRLALVNSLILLLALGVSAVLLFLQLDHQFQARDQERVDQRMRAIIKILNQNPDIGRDRLLGILGELSGSRLRIDPVEPRVPLPQPAARQGEPSRGTAVMELDQVVGYLQADNLVAERQLTRQALWQALLGVSIAAFAISAAAGLLLTRGITRPLSDLALAASAIGEGRLSARAAVAGPDELKSLAVQLNRMAGTLEESFSAQERERDRLKRLISDLSHELKTPLTALRTFTELMVDDLEANPAAHPDHRRFLSESTRQLERLQWLVQTLLDLSRLDAGFIQLSPRLEPLAETAARAVATLDRQIREKGVTLVQSIEPDWLVWHDARWLELALSNLLDNALRFTPAGGQITVRAVRRESETGLAVIDSGPGIPPSEQPHLFDRFYRGREQPGGSRGSGLGLAIVQAVAAAHGGRADVTSQIGSGSEFTIWLPDKPPSGRPDITKS